MSTPTNPRSRPPWTWYVPRLLLLLALLPMIAIVGGPSGVASYHHALEVVYRFSDPHGVNDWLPATTDGMLVLGIVLMYIRRWRGERVGAFAWLVFASGGLATVGANVASAFLRILPSDDEHAYPVVESVDSPEFVDIVGALAVSLWPPLCFALTLELVAALLRELRAFFVYVAPEQPTAAAALVVVEQPPAAPQPEQPVAPARPRKPSTDDTAPVTPPPVTPPPVDEPAPKRRATKSKAPRGGMSDDDIVGALVAEAVADPTRTLRSMRTTKTEFGLGDDRARDVIRRARVLLDGEPAPADEPVEPVRLTKSAVPDTGWDVATLDAAPGVRNGVPVEIGS